jgi:hypothetical protein
LPIILVDSREKQPLEFPETVKWYDEYRKPHLEKLTVRKAALKQGDYALEGHEKLMLVERKGSPSELWQNLLTKDHRRARASLTRLAQSCKIPVLMLDCSVIDLYSKDYQPKGLLPSAFLREVSRLGLHLFFAGRHRARSSRRTLGGFLASWMLEAVRVEDSAKALDVFTDRP